MIKLYDLSQPLFERKIDNHPFFLPSIEEILSVGKDPLNVQVITAPTHYGTHVDAPKHFIPGGKSIDEIPLEQLMGPGIVVTVNKGRNEEIILADVKGYDIKKGDIVLINTGWYRKYSSNEYEEHPYLSVEVAEFFVKTQIKMVGIDCNTVDMPLVLRSKNWQQTGFDFPVHRMLLQNEVLIVENLSNLDAVSHKNVNIYAVPVKIFKGDGGFARVWAEGVLSH